LSPTSPQGGSPQGGAPEREGEPTVPTNRIEIRLPSRADYLGAVRSILRGFLEECLEARLTEEQVNEIQMALQEACINVVRHAHGKVASRPLVVSITAAKDRLVLEVEDYGPGLPDRDRQPPDPDPANPREGGYGLFMMRQVMDEVRSERRGAKHVLVLVKRLAGGGPAGGGR
jgi:anti-sigma regulatory factor (Ser/Thr protein kinase)